MQAVPGFTPLCTRPRSLCIASALAPHMIEKSINQNNRTYQSSVLVRLVGLRHRRVIRQSRILSSEIPRNDDTMPKAPA